MQTGQFHMQTAEFHMQTGQFHMQTAEFHMQTAEFHMQTGPVAHANRASCTCKQASRILSRKDAEGSPNTQLLRISRSFAVFAAQDDGCILAS
ncbi:MAG: hypothetical protein DMF56_05170 [Acidobacteria bacterium]|nr:MAG: hypothetical protein DMF56_05170 [Acidobacteriota bacterium]